MDEARLREALQSGRSIESIADEVRRDPSTVAYWVKKYGLVSAYAAKYAARGPLPEPLLSGLVARHLTVREIAEATGRSYTTVRYWLKRYVLNTTSEARVRPMRSRTVGKCPKHGIVEFISSARGPRCGKCRADAVSAWRRRAKQILVEEAGGSCRLCGYSGCAGAMHFHHLDPASKRFGLGTRGLAQSIDKLRAEARKCILLCSNCHAEVEAGVKDLSGALP